ncbi:MAG: bifunctional nuclease family protein [Actinomycetota bacterium]|nr:bifunctional nuclease family protein [Actinomycetota bacterium]
MVEVRLTAVRVDLQSNTPVILLQEPDGAHRTLPIFIGAAEATAIALAQQGVATPRPMTHDLLRDVIESLDARVDHVVVTELRAATFYAEIHLRSGSGETVVSSRPSDAVALAVRVSCPLYVSDELMDSEAVVLQLDDEDDAGQANPDSLVGEFREFLDKVKPEDFGSTT